MHVVATAGHVDHGKSTLVRALTGMEPDRWAEERRRGMTIDLGYAWMPLDDDVLAFVDVPGHERFVGNMLAGLGPAPAVMFVVAADEGWRRQSDEHLAAIDALGLSHGLLVVTRSDRADPAAAVAEARAQLATTSLAGVAEVAVSPVAGLGMDELRRALADLAAGLPAPVTDGPVRLWIDRAFTVVGAGTVVTATLGAGHLAIGDDLELNGTSYRVRGLQQLGASVPVAGAVSRVAVNLNGLGRDQVSRGDVLLTPGAWTPTDTVDVRLSAAADPPAELTFHFGTAAVSARLRLLSADTARLRLGRPIPLAVGDRAILRDPGAHRIVAGVEVLALDPPAFARRGAARRRAAELTHGLDAVGELNRRGWLRRAELTALGLDPGQAGGHPAGDWLVSDEQWHRWQTDLLAALDAHAAADPLDPGMTGAAVQRAIGLPDPSVLTALVAEADVVTVAGRFLRRGVTPSLGPAEARVRLIEEKLKAYPFAAPERDDLDLDARELKVAETTGRLLRLADGVYVLPTAPALAMRALSTLPAEFTMSEARQALNTTRRVAVPLLEHLDARGWTERLDAGHRRVKR